MRRTMANKIEINILIEKKNSGWRLLPAEDCLLPGPALPGFVDH